MANLIQWNGIAQDGRVSTYTWSTADFTWSEFALAAEIAEISGTGSYAKRKRRLEQWVKKQPQEKKHKIVRMICRIKGQLVYDEKKTVSVEPIEITIEDIDILLNEIAAKFYIKRDLEEIKQMDINDFKDKFIQLSDISHVMKNFATKQNDKKLTKITDKLTTIQEQIESYYIWNQ